MKRHENQEVVNELKRILKEDYPYLEYSDQMSKKLSEDFKQVSNDQLYVRVRPGMEHIVRDTSVIEDVCEKLYQATGIPFHIFHVQPPGRFYKGCDQNVPPQNLKTQWVSFCLKNDISKRLVLIRFCEISIYARTMSLSCIKGRPKHLLRKTPIRQAPILWLMRV